VSSPLLFSISSPAISTAAYLRDGGYGPPGTVLTTPGLLQR